MIKDLLFKIKLFKMKDEYKTPSDLTRENLNLNPVNWNIKSSDKLRQSREYAEEAQNILNSSVFTTEIDQIIRNEVEHIAQFSRREQDMLLSRGSINGVCLLRETLERIVFEYKAKKLEEKLSEEEKFTMFPID